MRWCVGIVGRGGRRRYMGATSTVEGQYPESEPPKLFSPSLPTPPRELNCGNHLCELTCHTAPCPPCPLLPSHITTCPCGAMPLSALLSPDQSRTSCLDPVPTCDRPCGKVLPCSTKGIHYVGRKLDRRESY